MLSTAANKPAGKAGSYVVDTDLSNSVCKNFIFHSMCY